MLFTSLTFFLTAASAITIGQNVGQTGQAGQALPTTGHAALGASGVPQVNLLQPSRGFFEILGNYFVQHAQPGKCYNDNGFATAAILKSDRIKVVGYTKPNCQGQQVALTLQQSSATKYFYGPKSGSAAVASVKGVKQ